MESGNAWRRPGQVDAAAHEVACRDFLAVHSAYIDGELTADERAVHECHEARCASCARYASVLRRGSSLLRALPEITPASDFEERLQHRIYHIQDRAALTGEQRRRRGWLAAAAVSLVAAGPFLLAGLDREQRASDPAFDTEAAFGYEGALGGLAQWETPAVPSGRQARALPPAIAGYSPVVVRPPLYQPVSYQLMGGE